VKTAAARESLLYEQWRSVARKRRKEVALVDIENRQRWTFGQLEAEGEKQPEPGPIAFPQGRDFIVTLLRAWRAGQVVCPLDPSQKPPELGTLPTGCVHIKATSATGGVARWVAFRGEQLAADANNIVATMGLRPDWPNLAAISLAHSYGFSNLVLPLLLHGIPLIVAESPLPESVRNASKSVHAITLAGVPALWRAWHDAGAIPENVRLAISAGAPLAISLEQSVFDRQRLKIHNFYGSSECGGIAYDAGPAPRSDDSLAGSPMNNVRLEVGEDGCLKVRSEAVGNTYWPQADKSLSRGCFHTSDLAEMRDGMVYLCGRAGDRINVAGRKVSPEEIEAVLATHPQVRECLVLGVPSPDETRSDSIAACIVGNETLTGELLREFLLARLPAWQVPREWRFVQSLETGERGKPSRAAWRRRFQDDRASSLLP
jgi:acyl-CoA synthetase (AMP-forming)/AMP-acid ligase II